MSHHLLGAACLALAASCVPLRFRAPTLPSPPALVSPPTLPEARVVERALLPDDARVSARGLRVRHDTVLAVGPIPGAAPLTWELLRRVLARSVVPVLDLSGMERLSAHVEPSARARALRLEGPLLAATWAAELGSATHLLVTEAVSVGDERVRVERRRALSPDERARYQEELTRGVARCRQSAPQMERDLVGAAAAWSEAEERFRRGVTFLHVPDVQSERDARAVYDATVALFNARIEACQGIEARARDPHADEVSEGERSAIVARGSFRLVAVPGGELLWSASLTRSGAGQAEALGALLDALLDALPVLTRPAPQEQAAPSAEPAPTHRGHGRHRRRREGAR